MGVYKDTLDLLHKAAAADEYKGKYDGIGGGDVATGFIADVGMAPVTTVGNLAKLLYYGGKKGVKSVASLFTGSKNQSDPYAGKYSEAVAESGGGNPTTATELAMARTRKGLAPRPTPTVLRQQQMY